MSKARFTAAITILPLFNPPGVNSAPSATIPANGKETVLVMNAAGNAQVRKWKTAVVAVSDAGQGPMWVSSQLATIDVAAPYVVFNMERSAVEQGKVAWMVEAADGSADGRRKMLQSARRASAAGLRAPDLFGVFTSEELGLALGLGNVIHLAFLAGRGAERWTVDVERLSGFRPLLPLSWREEP